jgi:LPXTG-motif cell wall-anchored protein
MPAGCSPSPVTPAAPVTPAVTPATPTPIAQTVQGENVPTAGQGENETAPNEGDVEGETSEGTPSEETPTPAATAAPGPTQEASAGELPFTGMNAWWLGLLGFTAAGTGVFLRRRTSD